MIEVLALWVSAPDAVMVTEPVPALISFSAVAAVFTSTFPLPEVMVNDVVGASVVLLFAVMAPPSVVRVILSAARLPAADALLIVNAPSDTSTRSPVKVSLSCQTKAPVPAPALNCKPKFACVTSKPAEAVVVVSCVESIRFVARMEAVFATVIPFGFTIITFAPLEPNVSIVPAIEVADAPVTLFRTVKALLLLII